MESSNKISQAKIIFKRADKFAYILAIGNTIALIFVDLDLGPYSSGPGEIFEMLKMYSKLWFPVAGLILFSFYFFFETQRIYIIRYLPTAFRKFFFFYIFVFAGYFLFQNPLLIYEFSHGSLINENISIKFIEFVFIILLPIIVHRLQVKLRDSIKQIS